MKQDTIFEVLRSVFYLVAILWALLGIKTCQPFCNPSLWWWLVLERGVLSNTRWNTEPLSASKPAYVVRLIPSHLLESEDCQGCIMFADQQEVSVQDYVSLFNPLTSTGVLESLTEGPSLCKTEGNVCLCFRCTFANEIYLQRSSECCQAFKGIFDPVNFEPLTIETFLVFSLTVLLN